MRGTEPESDGRDGFLCQPAWRGVWFPGPVVHCGTDARDKRPEGVKSDHRRGSGITAIHQCTLQLIHVHIQCSENI